MGHQPRLVFQKGVKRKADNITQGKEDNRKKPRKEMSIQNQVIRRGRGDSTFTHDDETSQETHALGDQQLHTESRNRDLDGWLAGFEGLDIQRQVTLNSRRQAKLSSTSVFPQVEPVGHITFSSVPHRTQTRQEKDRKQRSAEPPVLEGKTIVERRADWFATELPDLPEPALEDTSDLSMSMNSLKGYGRMLLDQDASVYSKSLIASSTHKFLSTIMSSGTMADKVSALTLAVQESPVHNVRAFEMLLGLASKKSRSQALVALSALVDLLGTGLVLPAHRKLRHFCQQPGLIGVLQRKSSSVWNPGDQLPNGLTPAHLIIWSFEDWLKDAYFKVVRLLEKWCGDEVGYSRTRALDFVYGLLREKPEQESNLLKLLVNKLGDKDRRLASRSSYLLLQLQNTHPGIKGVVINNIEQEIMLRPRQTLRARYYAVNTLNQTILSRREGEVANMLMRLYFSVFSSMLKNEQARASDFDESRGIESPGSKDKRSPRTPVSSNTGDHKEKLVSAILTGINRAAAFVDGDEASFESQLDTLFRIAHSSNFSTSIQALVLIQQLSSTRHVAVDRFYRTLYESLLDPRLTSTSKQAMYLNLLLRSLKCDSNARRVKAFAKRMIQVLILHQPPFVCGILYVLSQLYRTVPALATLIEEPEEAFECINRGLAPASDRQPQHGYDGRKRDPEHSNAHRTCLWEIMPTMRHFHPSVLVYAASVMDLNQKTHKPDLESHSLIRFLDKLSYRNPKTKELFRGGSIMQPLQARSPGMAAHRQGRNSRHADSVATNSAEFMSKKPDTVPAEDVFFHRYFCQTRNPNLATAPQVDEQEHAPGHSIGDEEDDEIWQALTGGVKDDEAVEGEADSESDVTDELLSSLSSIVGRGSDDISHLSSDSLPLGAPNASESEDAGDGGDSRFPKSGRNGEANRRLRDLPTFASLDEYDHLLREDDDV